MDYGMGEPLEASLFEGEGALSDEDQERLDSLDDDDEEQVRGVHMIQKKHRVSIGVPISLPLTPLLQSHGRDLPVDIQLQMQDFEFYQIQFACSFEAATNYRFHEARFQLTLETKPFSLKSGTLHPAIAYDLFPMQLEDQRQIKVKRSLTPEVKFTFDPFSSSLSLPAFERDEEYLLYTSRLKAFDLQGTQPAWTFTRTRSHDIAGAQKLFMIVRKPKGTQVYATFRITASVEYLLGNGILDPFPLSFFLRRRTTSSTRAESPGYPLC